MSVFGIGLTGLSAAQAGVITAGHNISNANTDGYHRQSIQQSAAQPVFTGAGFFGQGVKVDTVVRAYNEFLETQVIETGSQAAFFTAYETQIARVDNLLGDPSTGVSPALQEFFRAVQGVAADPASVPARQSMVSAGVTLVSRFNALVAQFNETRTGINAEITSSIGEINAIAEQISDFNQQIVLAQSNPGQPPNDLLDRRDEAVRQLSQVIRVSVLEQTDGTISVFIGNGQNLVIGSQAQTLIAVPSIDDPTRTEVGYINGANTILLNNASLRGGSLGGLLAFRTSDLDSAQNALGLVALGLAETFNDQQRLGQDLNGAIGSDFFDAPQPFVIDRSTNTGTAVIGVSVNDATVVTASDYRLSFAGGNFTLTRLSDNTTNTFAALPQTIDGLTISLTAGAVANGDIFLIQPTRHAARDLAISLGDPRGIAAAAPIRTATADANTGSAAISPGTVNGPPPVNVNLQQPVTITFTGAATFNVTGVGTGNPVGVAYTSGNDITFNGWTVQITGTPAAGDVFSIGPNSGGVSDGRNALLLAGLQTRNTLVGSTTTYQGAYSQLVSALGSTTNRIQIAAESNTVLADQALQARQSVSGVNLDEEAADLLRFQQAFQASAKLVQVGSTLLDVLFELGS